MRATRIAALSAAGGLALAMASVAPAMAQGCPGTGAPASCETGITVSETVNETVNISGLTNLAFPAGNPGATVTGAETYATSTNDPLGYKLTLQPAGSAMAGSGSATIPNSALTVQNCNGSAACQAALTLSGSTVQLDAEDQPAAASHSNVDNWTLTIPAGQTPGAYSETFTYIITGN